MYVSTQSLVDINDHFQTAGNPREDFPQKSGSTAGLVQNQRGYSNSRTNNVVSIQQLESCSLFCFNVEHTHNIGIAGFWVSAFFV